MKAALIRAWLLLCVFTIVSFNTSAGSSIAVRSNEEISYPPKQPSVEIRDISRGLDTLEFEVKDLTEMIATDIRKRGVIRSVQAHQKFYGSILVFGLLTLLWLKNRNN